MFGPKKCPIVKTLNSPAETNRPAQMMYTTPCLHHAITLGPTAHTTSILPRATKAV